MGLVVAGETAVVHEPAEGPLDDPAPRNHLEALLGRIASGDFDVDAEGGAVFDDLGAVARVGPCLRDTRVVCGDVREYVDAAGIVGDAGGGDQYGQEEAECVDADVAFAACDLLARVDALAGGRDIRGGLDALGVQDAGGRLGVAAFGFPDQAPQESVELVEDRVLLPSGEVAVDGLPRGEVVRQVPPGDPGPVDEYLSSCPVPRAAPHDEPIT